MLTPQPNILLVEDEPFLAKVVSDSLEQLKYNVTHANDGKKAYSQFLNMHFDLCIIDVMLPQTDGFTLARQIRMRQQHTPILFVTARISNQDIIEGYESGGNDYLKKPFSLEELFFRVRELLKRSKTENVTPQENLFIGHYLFVPHKQTLQYSYGQEVKLSHRETQLLQLLHQHKNTLLDRKKALITLWGDDSFFNTRTMDVFITKLRKHLREDSNVEILNIRGMGYKLVCA